MFCPVCGFPIGKVAKETDDPLIGRTLPGGYSILELVGVGGMGRVYRAEQTTLGRTVAVKIIHPHLVGEENAAARFITEARAASRLNHPNSVGVIDFGKTNDGQLYLVMEFLRGSDLARVNYDEGPLSLRRIVDILTQVLAALSEAHALEIIHRDLKPENVILEPMRSGKDFVKVVDFGLAKMRAEVTAPSITSPGIVCGTPEYMSPEQGRGDVLDARSDLYSVAVILFQLLAGRLPFEAESPTQVVLMHLTEPPPDPRHIAPERAIPEAIVEVVLRALSKHAKDRYPDADAFAAALTDALHRVEGAASSVRSLATHTARCNACGAMNPASQKFCGECGASISQSQVASPRATMPTYDDQSPPGRRAAEPKGRIRLPLPMLGRDEDFAWLDERRAEARSTLVGVRVLGEPGIGKTRLLREFLAVSAAAGDVVVEAGPDPAWAEIGYFALRRVIRTLGGLPEDGGTPREWVAASAETRRGLRDVFGKDDERSDLSPEERRYSAAEALRWALVRAAERAHGQRVVVAVDDFNHVDGASRNAFIDAILEPPLVPALLLLAAPPTFQEPLLQGTTSRVVQGIPTSVVSRLLSETVQASAPPVANAKTISPYYLDQLIRFGREHGGGAPSRLADLVALRVERLPADARRALQAVAVLGDDATAEMLVPLLPDDLDLVEAMGALQRSAMVDSLGDSFRTTHPLLREVVLATIPAQVRKQLHEAAASVCEDAGAPTEVLAVHEYFAGNSFQALLLLERVSALSNARGDVQGSVLSLRRCLDLARRELFRGELDDPMRAVVIFSRKLGEALGRAGAYTDAEGVLREALDMTGPSGEDRTLVMSALANVDALRRGAEA
ncbi:MAG: protein kinase [Polyangiaceae bacterium]